MPGILPIRLRPLVITCFPGLESRTLNELVLIPFLPRARGRGGTAPTVVASAGTPNPEVFAPAYAQTAPHPDPLPACGAREEFVSSLRLEGGRGSSGGSPT